MPYACTITLLLLKFAPQHPIDITNYFYVGIITCFNYLKVFQSIFPSRICDTQSSLEKRSELMVSLHSVEPLFYTEPRWATPYTILRFVPG